MSSIRANNIYSNCIVLDHQDEVIFRCSDSRARWYLNRNLAEIICDSPLTMKLKFIPGGKGNAGDVFYCGPKENKCVVCGTESLVELTKHHVVPYWLRRHFPVEYRDHTSHDVLPVCRQCHDIYEAHVQKITDNIVATDTEVCGGIRGRHMYLQMLGIAGALIKHKEVIPEKRQNEILNTLSDFLKKDVKIENLSCVIDEITNKIEQYNEIVGSRMLGRRIVEKLHNIDQFILFWRKDFVETMQPKFLPAGWDIYHKTTR